MAQVVATVSSLQGIFYIKQKDGSLQELSVGDKIYEGNLVVGADSNSIADIMVLEMNDMSKIIMTGDQQQLFDAMFVYEPFSADETVSDATSIETLFNDDSSSDIVVDTNNGDTDEVETAAGNGENTPSDLSYNAEFQEINLQNQDNRIDVELKNSNLSNSATSSTIAETSNDIYSAQLHDNIINLQSNVDNLTQAANDATTAANAAAAKADAAAAKADANPTPENLAVAQAMQVEADSAAVNATNAASILSAAIATLSEAAKAANEDINVETANSAVENALNASAHASAVGTVINDRVSELSDSDVAANTVNENVPDGTYTGVTLSAVDVDGDAVTYSLPDDVPFRVESDGRVVVNGDNTIDFESAKNYTFTATATSADGTSSNQEVSININDINDTPEAANDTITTTENNLIDVTSAHASINAGNIHFTDGFSISQTIKSTGNGGIIFNNENSFEIAQYGDGSIKYALRADDGKGWVWNDTGYDLPFNETHNVAFTYDGKNNTVKLYVDGSEVASSTKNVPDSLKVYEHNNLLFGERGNNNQSFEGTFNNIQIHDKALSANDIQTIANGGVVTDGLVAQYDFEGDNPLADKSGNGHDATLVNGADIITTTEGPTEDHSVTISSETLLANDIDSDNNSLSLVSVQDGEHGSASLVNGDVIFTPEENYFGPASFTYTISDGHGGVDTATVNLTIQSVNDLPVINVENSVSVDEDGQATITYSLDDIDSESVALTASATHGSVHVNDNGTLTFRPNADYNGNDTIVLKATDSDGGVTRKDIAVTVNSVNDAPVAHDDTQVGELNAVVDVTPAHASINAGNIHFTDGL